MDMKMMMMMMIGISSLHLSKSSSSWCNRNMYCNDPKFSERQVWANSVDPNQTDPEGYACPCFLQV